MSTPRTFLILILLGSLSGCALITTPVKVAGVAATTTIKTTGSVVSAPFEMAGDSDDD